MKVVMCEAGKEAYVTEIGTDLESLQKAVDGLIETYYPFEEEVCVVCNDEGKILRMPYSRAIRDEDGDIIDVIAGPFFICDCSGEEFASLSDEQQKRYLEMFRRPEKFRYRDDGVIVVTPYEPLKQDRER